MDKETQKNLIVVGLILVGLYFVKKSFLDPLAEKLGLKDSEADENQERNLSSKWLTPVPFSDWVKKTGYKIPSVVENFVISGLVNKIYDAKGFFNDDEEAVYNFFRKLETKMQASATAFYFKREFGRDLSAYLASFMSSEEIQKVADIIASKKENLSRGLISSNFGK